jgi:fibro-slime domain-containing protein
VIRRKIWISLAAVAPLACSPETEDSRYEPMSSGSDNASSDDGLTTTGLTSDVTGDSDDSAGDDGSGIKLDIDVDNTGDCDAVLPITLRDFKGLGEAGGHPDFEISARGVYHEGELYKGWNDVGCGLVDTNLGADRKPSAYWGPPDIAQGGPSVKMGVGRQQRVVTGDGCWPATSGTCEIGTCQPWIFDPPTYEIESTSSFDQWFNETPGINMEFESNLVLSESPPSSGIYVYDSTAFFPLDGQGFGNTPGESHNYHFTTEVHVTFEYEAGQQFTFRGDDDLWVFVNGKLALDVGGLHEDLQGTIDFDAQASALGITPGGVYDMDIFHAERQTEESNFRIETNISCFTPNPVD